MFSPSHLEVIRRALKDDAAYALLIDALPRLERIIVSARGQGCTLVRCALREHDLSIVLRFSGDRGQRLIASFSFRRKYQRNGNVLSLEMGLALRLAIETLLVIAGGFALAETNSSRR